MENLPSPIASEFGNRPAGMAKEREEKEKKETLTERDDAGRKSTEDGGSSSDSDDSDRRERRRKKSSRKHGHGRRRSPSSESSDGSESESDYSFSAESSASGSAEEDEDNGAEIRRRRKRRRKEREHEKETERRRKEKEREKKRRRKKEREEKEKKKKKKEKEKKKMGAVTNSWGKYGIIRETDMWNKRPEFTAWLAEIKQVNMESLSNREEKQMFKEFMEDHNTATFPSKKYYNLDAYHRRMILKEAKKGSRKTSQLERTVFNDEEQRRQELLMERERQKEEQVKALKYSMESGMAQAMKEQAQLREEMNYQYRLGNFEAAAAIQRRLDPDLPM